MEELYENVPLLIIGVPRGHNLLELGFHIEKIVGLKNIITSIKWKSNSNPSLSNVKLKVCSSKGANALMKNPTFDIFFEGKNWSLTVTRLRSTSKKASEAVVVERVAEVESASTPFSSSVDDGASKIESEQLEVFDEDYNMVNYLKPCRHAVKAAGSGKIIHYVNKSSSLSNLFHTLWKDVADVTISPDAVNPFVYTLEFDPAEKLESKTQEDFEAECDMMLRTFLSRFSSATFGGSAEMLQNFREKSRINKSIEWNIDGNLYECFFKWNLESDPAQVTITGENVAVQSIFRRLQLESEQTLAMSSPKAPDDSAASDYNIHQQCSWSELLEEDPKLFKDYKDSCIIVQHLPESCTYAEARSFFEKKKISGGGKVKRIIHLPDGYLVAFENINSATAIVENIDDFNDEFEVAFSDNLPTLLPKVVPPPDDRLICIEKKDLSKEVVEDLLGSLSQLDSAFEIVERSKKCLVIFETPVDTYAVTKEILKHEKFKVKRFCHSDCFLISGFDPQVSKDRLKLAFAKQCDAITYVQNHRKKVTEALMFVSNYKDVSSILDGKPICIDGVQMEMRYCVHGFGILAGDKYKILKNSRKKNSKLSKRVFIPKSFSRQFSLKDEVLTIFTECRSVANLINDKLAGIAQVQMCQTAGGKQQLEASFIPVLMQRENLKNQNGFENRCCNEILDLTATFTSVDIFNLSDGAVKRIKRISYNARKNISLIDKENHHLLIRWKTEEENAATVTGTRAGIQYLKEMHEVAHDLFPSTKANYQILSDCGIVVEVESLHSVKISRCEGVGYNLFIEGTKPDIDAAKNSLQKELQRIDHTQNFGLAKVQERFLSDLSLRAAKELGSGINAALEVETKINKTFRESRLKASLQLTSLTLHHKTEHLRECRNILQKLILVRQYPVKSDFNEMKYSLGWKELQNFIEFSECLKLYDENATLTLVGLDPKFSNAHEMVLAQLSQSDEKIELIIMDKVKRDFIRMFAPELKLSPILKDIEMETEDNGLRLKGKQRLLKEVVPEIKRIEECLVIASHPVEESWKVKYMESGPGKEFLEFLQQTQQCLIALENNTDIVKEEKIIKQFNSQEMFNLSKQFQPRSQMRYPEVRIPRSHVVVKLVKGDITTHEADAIVNASNEELDLRPAGVSGSILDKGGKSIQEEMTRERFKLAKKKLTTGRAVTTNAGRLRNCRKIVHVAGPIWSEHGNKSAQFLKMSVLSCLMEAEKHQLSSIAVPAISCGVFGGSPDESAKLIVEAIVEFFDMKKKPFLKRVDLIELSRTDIVRAFTKYLNKLPSTQSGNDGGHHNQSQKKFASSDVAPPPTQAVKVIVEVGDILSQRTDVVLNTAGRDFNLSLSKLSQLLVQKAGQQIVEDCEDPSKCVSSGFKFRITNAGALNCQYVAHLIVDSNQASNQPLLQQIPMDLLAVFKAVNKLEHNSIAIPAIGTGNAGLRPKDAVNAIRSAIEMYEQTKPQFLTAIKIVIFDTKLYSDFECLTTTETVPVIETPPVFDIPSTSRYDQFSYLNPTPHRVKESIPTTMMLKLCSKHEQTNVEVLRKIDFKFETKYKEKSISDISPNLKIVDFLDSLRQNSDVKIREENGSDGLQVTVSGFEDDVNDICEKLVKFLKTARE